MAIVLDYIKDAELFNKTAEHWAGKIVGTKSTQIRNFYEYVLELNQRAENEVWNEVLPFVPDAFADFSKNKIGYEIPFTRYFYKYTPPRQSAEIKAEILAGEHGLADLLEKVLS